MTFFNYRCTIDEIEMIRREKIYIPLGHFDEHLMGTGKVGHKAVTVAIRALDVLAATIFHVGGI
jgi:hypothetical protein